VRLPRTSSAANRLRAFRARQGGISQAKAAALTNTPKRTWEGWETEGKEPPPCLWRLLDYVDRFGPMVDSNGYR
jgi:DNA-binding transcriptional regulator YiaG